MAILVMLHMFIVLPFLILHFFYSERYTWPYAIAWTFSFFYLLDQLTFKKIGVPFY